MFKINVNVTTIRYAFKAMCEVLFFHMNTRIMCSLPIVVTLGINVYYMGET